MNYNLLYLFRCLFHSYNIFFFTFPKVFGQLWHDSDVHSVPYDTHDFPLEEGHMRMEGELTKRKRTKTILFLLFIFLCFIFIFNVRERTERNIL